MSKSVDYNGVYFCMTLSGHIEHVMNAAQDLRSKMFDHPDFSDPYRSLWDFRCLEGTSKGMSESDFRAYMVVGGTIPEKIAYVVDSDLIYGVIRQFATVREPEDGQLTMLLTHSLEEADEFLRS